jgi:hypothetical protein
VLLLHDAPLELVTLDFLLLKNGIAPCFEGGEALIEPARAAAIEPHSRLGEAFQEAAVMADEHHGRAGGLERRLQALYGYHVEMVGRLIEQQDIGFRCKNAGKRCAPTFSTGESCWLLLPRQAETLQQIARTVRIVARSEPRLDEVARGCEAGKVGCLRQIADRHRRLHEAAAVIRLDQASGDFEQRRFARTVPSHQAQTLGRTDRELGAG